VVAILVQILLRQLTKKEEAEEDERRCQLQS
jgi:hypothetical protein